MSERESGRCRFERPYEIQNRLFMLSAVRAHSADPSAKGGLYGKRLLHVAARCPPERSEALAASRAIVAYGDIFVADARGFEE